ncbi:DUF4880 domain-containing protein [Ketobacter sp. MCCC 1A13808]|uniref:FecR domain-containing protein n=1 Tax=Ketobacter sp. MCCC 1A13808 TaxID=2602738 RepID=UPI0012EB343F|nr:FecR domain-containing protein [Ketobacter sp. MCCC 1A13808]MVF11532.1 DUF4880 domain-containing protein [Ketobacter sp. MCCC 1A13808]
MRGHAGHAVSRRGAAVKAALQRLADEIEVPLDVLIQALEWQVTSWSGEITEQESRSLLAWRSAREEHERAWNQVQSVSGRLSTATSASNGNALRSVRSSLPRRNALKVLGLMVGGTAALYGARESSIVQSRFAEFQTGTGETREIALSDGTRVNMNTRTAINTAFSAHERKVELVSGEIFVVSTKEADVATRPFIVQTRQGHVQPLGTRFGVRQDSRVTQVNVEQGRVLIAPANARNTAALDAGWQTRFTADDIFAVEPTPPNINAWTRGLLIVERQSLGDFLTVLGRYRSGYLRCDERAAKLVVSGSYPLADTDRVLAALELALPVRVRRLTPYWISVEAVA